MTAMLRLYHSKNRELSWYQRCNHWCFRDQHFRNITLRYIFWKWQQVPKISANERRRHTNIPRGPFNHATWINLNPDRVITPIIKYRVNWSRPPYVKQALIWIFFPFGRWRLCVTKISGLSFRTLACKHTLRTSNRNVEEWRRIGE